MSQSIDLLVFSADSTMRESVKGLAEGSGYSVCTTDDQAEALKLCEAHDVPVAVIIAVSLEDPLFDFHRKLRESNPSLQTIMIKDATSVVFGLRAAREGIFWVLEYPFNREELLLLIARATIIHNLSKENRELKSALSRTGAHNAQLHTRSEAMQRVIKRMHKIAELDATVLLTGESGTGKTLFASLIHDASTRREGPFMSISCANLPKDLIEAELFGYEKGAFTGAQTSRPGVFELSDKGTIFLDEIGELPLELQPKLLTVLQDKKVRRLGGKAPKEIDVRIVCATNRDLSEAVHKGTFREDLFYRINVLTLELPPLRGRKEDIETLAISTLREKANKNGREDKHLSPEALKELQVYEWPGNVRELGHVLERVVAFSEKAIISKDEILRELPHHSSSLVMEGETFHLVGKTLQELESLAIEETLKACDGDKAKAAKMLGISLKTIYNQLKKRESSHVQL